MSGRSGPKSSVGFPTVERIYSRVAGAKDGAGRVRDRVRRGIHRVQHRGRPGPTRRGRCRQRLAARERLQMAQHRQAPPFGRHSARSDGSILDANRGKIGGVFHMGAISTTTETDIDAIVYNNIRLSIDLWTWCSGAKVPLVHASSATTYGDAREGFFLTVPTPTIWPGRGHSTRIGGARPNSTAGSSMPFRPALHVRRDGLVSNFVWSQ